MIIELSGDQLPEAAVEPDVLNRMNANELLKLIDQLPEGYRMVFNLNVIEGYAHKEIADMLGIEESSSRSQLTKARKHIQRFLVTLHKAAV